MDRDPSELTKKQHEEIVLALEYYEQNLYGQAQLVQEDRQATSLTHEGAVVTDLLKIIRKGEYFYGKAGKGQTEEEE